MYKQNAGPAPKPGRMENRNPRATTEPAPELLVQYPEAEPVSVTLAEPTLWDEIASAAMSRRLTASRRAEHLADGNAAIELLPDSEAASSWLAVGAGLVLVAALWAAILF